VSALTSVLVVRLSSLGDVLFAVPAVQHLQRSGRAGHVAWLVEDRAAGLLRELVPLDELLVFPRGRRSAWPAHIAALRRRRDDVVLDLQCNLKSRLQRIFLRAPRKLGYARPIAREGGERGLTESFSPSPHCRHRVDCHLAALSMLGVEPPSEAPRPELKIPRETRARARTLLARAPGSGPVVVLHPGTSAFGQLKRWDPARFAALGSALASSHEARLIVTGGPGEQALVAGVLASLGRRALAVPPEGLTMLAALLAESDLLVASDSLPLHLANALGTPVVGLYGPKDPAITGPRFDRSEVLTAGVACSPCTLRRCSDRLCMRRLEVDDVGAACARLLAEPRA